jgi:hypothetical protein
MNRRQIIAAFLFAPFAALVNPPRLDAASEIDRITDYTIQNRFPPSWVKDCRDYLSSEMDKQEKNKKRCDA